MKTMNATSNRESALPEERYKDAYLGSDFVRLASYRQQLQYACREPHRRALVVGKGDGLVPQLMKDQGIDVVMLDVNSNLEPDLLGSVERIPAPDNSFDVCLCCQVLEHLPFERFESCLREIRRVTSSHLILSLPDIRRFASLRVRVARWKWEWSFSLPRLRQSRIPGDRLTAHGHYWEIGYRGFELGPVVEAIANSGLTLLEIRRVPDLAWHTFFYCQTKSRAERERESRAEKTNFAAKEGAWQEG